MGQYHKEVSFHNIYVGFYNLFILLLVTNLSFNRYNFKVGNVMNHLSFKTGIDTYLSVLIIAMNAFLAVVAVGTFLALIGVV
jgi:hypothetical protein